MDKLQRIPWQGSSRLSLGLLFGVIAISAAIIITSLMLVIDQGRSLAQPNDPHSLWKGYNLQHNIRRLDAMLQQPTPEAQVLTQLRVLQSQITLLNMNTPFEYMPVLGAQARQDLLALQQQVKGWVTAMSTGDTAPVLDEIRRKLPDSLQSIHRMMNVIENANTNRNDEHRQHMLAYFDHLTWLLLGLAVGGSLLVGYLLMFILRLRRLRNHLEETNHSLERRVEERTRELSILASMDMLTGLYNRRTFIERTNHWLAQHDDGGAVLMLDLDHFKQINDNYGHQAGDKALKYVARLMKEQLRDKGLFGRMGGEEFAILLFAVDEQQALATAEALRLGISQLQCRFDDVLIPLSASVGIALRESDRHIDPLLARADKALYRAKHEGRNRVVA
ncbi:GGDEF domain-containing protein [Pokkaliibacter sp. MBI-7]|uniref:GGDEF domain-containing protein n=1 Tax=Pokkaliibacter sp. MBI-7 TaxID=3040600 RepID=UPI00244BB482|nr:GGDEF domain-containing protein [Pokkaliibacter sp. MBI-7]MDH2432914.1 GGDEF domain-containing protein [Pokkaliibacter sp. MBI-7]